ncbi:hypothetical protein [Massilia horti]|uniref:Uncharacterized protein n=1 Tax=Massilia horti TaxID=2562153 RepID=A0A4Y9T5T1_9BURK|nr:hypothetical protein [Massilia horti]TFW35669.1 hypothetical protein E4O92_01555 [Massilia horti]
MSKLTHSLDARMTRELERERNERELNDEVRTGLSTADEFRTKDARERYCGQTRQEKLGLKRGT